MAIFFISKETLLWGYSKRRLKLPKLATKLKDYLIASRLGFYLRKAEKILASYAGLVRVEEQNLFTRGETHEGSPASLVHSIRIHRGLVHRANHHRRAGFAQRHDPGR